MLPAFRSYSSIDLEAAPGTNDRFPLRQTRTVLHIKESKSVKLKSKKELSLTIIYYALDALILKIVVTIEEILTIAIVLW